VIDCSSFSIVAYVSQWDAPFLFQQLILWDFLDERENRWLYSIDELEDLVAFFSDSEDSDWSDFDIFFD
jgi:hypothetical protein